jgi:hypothetical protein
MAAIYHYNITNYAGESLGTRLDLSRVIAIDEPHPLSVKFSVHFEGRTKALELYYLHTQRDKYEALIEAWRKARSAI